jgi:hypothetical protein
MSNMGTYYAGPAGLGLTLGNTVVANETNPNSYFTQMDNSGLSHGTFGGLFKNPPVNGEASLATLILPIGPGPVEQELYYYYIGGSAGPITGDAVRILTLANGATVINPVPIPPSMLLFGSGLVGFLGFRKRLW